MNRRVVLVALKPEDEDAQAFRDAIGRDPVLSERIELRFAAGEAIQAAIPEAEAATCSHLSEEMLEAAPRLRWISYWSAGMEGKATPYVLRRNLLLTNSSGVHGPNIAEHLLAYMLMFTRGMHRYLRSQQEGVWKRTANESELAGQTLGIVGLGRIGEALAARARAFEMRVVAIKRIPRARYEAEIRPDALYAPEELPRLLSESDHICITLPLTPETFHLFDAGMLAHCKPTAYLYNIARGKIIDEAALIAALQKGQLAGAGLDVFEIEPLPADSPLWKMENVLITPHVSGTTPHYFTRVAALFAANLKRYLDGQPLHNLFDPARGY